MKFHLTILLLVLLHVFRRSHGDNIEPVFSRCCDLGSNWGLEGLRCNSFPAPVAGIQAEQQSVCLSAVEICCLRSHRNHICELGKNAAKAGAECSSAVGLGGEYQKYCCEACKLGLISGAMAVDCEFKAFSFGPPWDLPYASCCLETHPKATTTPVQNSTTSRLPPVSVTPLPVVRNVSKPRDQYPEVGKNLCESFPGQLCAHTCVPTPGSYRCECREGFLLMSDERSCQLASFPDRCKINNPCAHKCFDTGIAIECSCNPGYQLGADETSCVAIDPAAVPMDDVLSGNKCPEGFRFNPESKVCDDIDECEWKIDNCFGNSICQNTIGSFKCIRTPFESCPPGYRYAEEGGSCLDIDECAEGTDNCKKDQQFCLNTKGSFTCQELSKRSQCLAGYKYNIISRSCEDVNECEENIHGCSPENEVCRNTAGAYECDTKCEEGFHFSEVLQRCAGFAYNIKEAPNKRKNLCPSGFMYNIDRKICLDVNECIIGSHNCITEAGEHCINIPGSFFCKKDTECSKGFKVNRNTGDCEDINECEEGKHNCRIEHVCVNTNGSFSCLSHISPPFSLAQDPSNRCAAGFRYNFTRKLCLDIDECSDQIHVCSKDTELCINEPGGYRCSPKSVQDEVSDCPPGYQKSFDKDECTDIDECQFDDRLCDSNQECENTPGSYICVCKPGYQNDQITQACTDINECQMGLHECTRSQRCDNTIGSYQCIRFTSCGTGYTLNAHTGLCEDDDECALRTDDCSALGPSYECRNTLGSFRCERKRCSSNQVLMSSGQCVNVQCSKGYQANNEGQCTDIDECSVGNPCKRNQRCLNTIGSFKCINFLSCGGGHELNDAGTHCVDIDECSRGTHDCLSDQTCQNRPGGYVCHCPAGYYKSQDKKCVDVDECTRYSDKVCSINSICKNTPGSYKCECKPGFKEGPDGQTCEDNDECNESQGLCQHNCINIWGGYRCTCSQGFTLHSDNRSCHDIDECQVFKDGRLCIGQCINEPGSYRCTCPEGYRIGSDGRSCQDIDECVTGNRCKPNEICIDTRGGFRCNSINCPPGYIRDKDHKNRCKRQVLYCREGDMECLRQPTAYVYNFISFVSNIPIPPTGQLDLFTMTGSLWSAKSVQFHYEMVNAQADPGVVPATKDHFRLRRTAMSQAVISLVRPIVGPQDIELQLSMEFYHNGVLGGSFVAKIFLYVSRYEF